VKSFDLGSFEIKKSRRKSAFLVVKRYYFAAGAAGAVVSAGADAAVVSAGAETGAATGASATGAGAGLLQAAKVKARTAAIRAERIIFKFLGVYYRKIGQCQFSNFSSVRYSLNHFERPLILSIIYKKKQ
jgi:hypothetical protein